MYSPKWSKVKKQLKSFTCDSLRDRIDFQIINYRKAHDQLGRAVITVDKQEILSMCTITAEREMYRKEWVIREEQNIEYDIDNHRSNLEIGIQAHEMIKKEGILAQYDFFDALEEYLSSPIEESLKSTDIIIKILSIIDRRVGKRTLQNLSKSFETEHENIRYFLKLRCDAEGVRVS
ncbi:SF0329 family protein [Robertmurraya sp. Marseille-Q9965]